MPIGDGEPWYLRLQRFLSSSQSRASHLSFVEDLNSGNESTENFSKAGWYAIHEAAAKNDRELLDFLLQHSSVFIDVLTEEHETPLFLACKWGYLSVVKKLIQYHASPNIGNYENVTPLLMAVQQMNVDIVATLLKENDVNVNCRNCHGWSPLHEACRLKQRQIVLILLKAGANSNIITEFGETPLYIASKTGDVECCEHLLRHEAHVNQANPISGQTALFIAASKNNVDCVRFLLSYGADANISNQDGLLPLHTAVWSNAVVSLQLLLPYTTLYQISKYSGMTPVQLAVFRHNLDALQVLLEHDFDVNPTKGISPLLLAALGNHESCLTALLSAGSNANKDDPLACCVSNNRFDMSDLLIKYGAAVYPRHMYLARSRKLLQLLLSAGLNPSKVLSCNECTSPTAACHMLDDWLIKHFANPHETLCYTTKYAGNIAWCPRTLALYPDLAPLRMRSLAQLCKVAIRSQFTPLQLLQYEKIFVVLQLPINLKSFLFQM